MRWFDYILAVAVAVLCVSCNEVPIKPGAVQRVVDTVYIHDTVVVTDCPDAVKRPEFLERFDLNPDSCFYEDTVLFSGRLERSVVDGTEVLVLNLDRSFYVSSRNEEEQSKEDPNVSQESGKKLQLFVGNGDRFVGQRVYALGKLWGACSGGQYTPVVMTGECAAFAE
jgi:hypothetical protein